MKLQTILYPSNSICNEEALYLHRDEGFILFDGYFNLFYLETHHKYCDIDELSLELKVSGIKKVRIMHDRDVVKELEAEGRVSIKLPYSEYKTGVFWFAVDVTGEEWTVEGYYKGIARTSANTELFDTESDKDRNNQPIELAVNICTYKREPYVIRNMKSLLNWISTRDIDGGIPEVAEHMHVFIVDNAKTLVSNEEFLSTVKGNMGYGDHNLIKVIPNDNTGGTGGFSRGMEEAIETRLELGLTHLLMMDDDAVFDPEIFVRLYGFISLLRPEYREITVGGALMREDYPYIQHAAGERYGQFKVYNDHLMTDLRNFDACTSDWMTGTKDTDKVYGAWWCCCYHMSAITRENMPLPIFVHHDDIQFGLRQQKDGRSVVFLNGICVWHQGFETVFPGVKQYYNMRNTLITSMLFEPEYLKKAIKRWAIKRYIGMLISYRYADCEFVYRGLMDFLKGKEWLMGSSPEDIHKELMATYKRICPLEKNEAVIDGTADKLSVEKLRDYYSHNRFAAPLIKKITFNGWFLPSKTDIRMITPLDSPWNCYRCRHVLLYEPGTQKSCLMKRSYKEFWKGMYRLIRMSIAIDGWKLGGMKW